MAMSPPRPLHPSRPHPPMKWMRILFAIDFQDNVYYFYYIRRQLEKPEQNSRGGCEIMGFS